MSAVKLNSVVELIEQKDKMPIGRVGRVIWYNDLLCVVSFDEDNDSVDGVRITHNGKGLCEPERPNSAYFVDTNMLKVTTKKTKIKPLVVKICKVCGSAIENGDSVYRTSNGAYVCERCMSIKSYSTKNNNVIGKVPKLKKRTFGFEFECVPKSRTCKANIVGGDMQVIPTSDSSLPSGGIEFKTPTYNSMRGLRRVFKTFYNNVDFSNSKCGQHINMGDRDYINSLTMSYIRRNEEMFEPLRAYMHQHRRETEHVCGRYFSGYCSSDDSYCHGSWLNLDHNDRFEFRIAKFRNPTQYLNQTQMWSEMMDVIISDAIKPWYKPGETTTLPNPIRFVLNRDAVSTKLIAVFNKYESRLKKLEEQETNAVHG